MLQINGYQLFKKLYESDRTLIYRGGYWRELTPVVLKIMKKEYPTPDELAAFEREYKICKSLGGEGVIEMYDLEKYRHGYLMVMEDFAGDSLMAWQREHQPVLAENLSLAVRICDILEHIHACNICHRNLTPTNLLWHSPTSKLKLTDFGLATVFPAESPREKEVDDVESLSYIAPEQTGRMVCPIDQRVDLYALGVILYELFAHRLPFQAISAMELVHCHNAHMPLHVHEVNPEVPAVVSHIVMKLLAKSPEDRYQSAAGVKADLQRCCQNLDSGDWQPFAIGEMDIPRRLTFPTTLYEREVETRAIEDAFAAVRHGDGRILLVEGESGVGKSSLVQAMQDKIVPLGGNFSSGKFTAANHHVPYSGLIQAFRKLIKRLLGQSLESVTAWQRQMVQAIGADVRLLLSWFPELQWLTNPDVPKADAGSEEMQMRFPRVLQSFLGTLANERQPLLLLLDDLQWADLPSLDWLAGIVCDEGMKHTLFICCYRQLEMAADKERRQALQKIETTARNASKIRMRPLSLEAVTVLVSETLKVSQEMALPLAQMCVQKTAGNPFFLKQFLISLLQQQTIWFDGKLGRWSWQMDKIHAMSITDNVVDLLCRQIETLPLSTLELLHVASALASPFEVETLAQAADRKEKEVHQHLTVAIERNLVLPVVPAVNFSNEDKWKVGYKFLHDHVQDTLYAMLGERQRPLHMQIGMRLRERWSEAERDRRIFELVNHFNIALPLIAEQAEKYRVAALNLQAGLRAKAANALASSLEYLRTGWQLLSPDSWQTQHALSFDLAKTLAEAEYLNGNFERSRNLIESALANAHSIAQQQELYELLVVQYTMDANYAQAIHFGVKVLSLSGVSVPEQNLTTAIDQEIAAFWSNLDQRPISALVNLPVATSPWAKTVLRILWRLNAPAYYSRQDLFYWIAARQVNLCMQHGHLPECLIGYCCFGFTLGAVYGNYTAGHEFGRLAIQLVQKFPLPAQKCQVYNMTANFILPWSRHIQETESLNNEGHLAGMQSGEWEFAGYILGHFAVNALFQGKNLAQVMQTIVRSLPFVRKTKNQIQIDAFLVQALALQRLLGHSEADDDRYDLGISEKQFVADCQQVPRTMSLAHYYIFKAQSLYLQEEYDQALEMAETASNQAVYPFGMLVSAEHNFYHSLSATAIWHQADAQRQQMLRQTLERNQRQMRIWHKHCPDNFSCRYLLVEAERERIAGHETTAMQMYDEAIAAAMKNGFVHAEAIANELAARFYLAYNRFKIAQIYMQEAVYGYLRWGAKAKVKSLQEKFPLLLAGIPQCKTQWGKTDYRETTGRSAEIFSIFKATQNIPRKNAFAEIVGSLMQSSIAISGASKAFFIMVQASTLTVVARHDDGCDKIHLDEAQPLDKQDLSCAVVHYVFRTQQLLNWNEGADQEIFRNDPYIGRMMPKSLLCFPLQYHGKIMAIVYLENELIRHAFCEKVIQLLEMVSQQAAISLENVMLSRNLEQEIIERKRIEAELTYHKERLELAVQKRTAELIQANQNLREEIAERTRMEDEVLKARQIESLGVLAGGIAHDFNNYLTAIIGNASFAGEIVQQMAGTSDNKELLDILSDIKTTSKEAAGLTAQLLTFAKGGAPVKKAVALEPLLRNTTSFSLRGSVIVQSFDIDGDLWLVEADQSQICQVIQNLIINAKQAMPGGGSIVVKAQNVCIGEQDRLPLKKGRYVRVSIKDSGPGIAQENLAKIFEPYFTTKTIGNGLGLAVVYSIIKKHDAYVGVESCPGVGSEFYFYLPALETRIPLPIAVKQTTPPLRGRILWMDDDAKIIKSAGRLLSRLTYESTFVSNGEEAIALYQQAMANGQPYDIVILDLTVCGGLGGQETIARLRQIDPQVKAIVSSGYHSDPVMASYADYGFSAVLTKPYTLEELSETLHSLQIRSRPS